MPKERFRPGNIAIFFAGADRNLLELWSVDRAYYVGLGMSVLFTAVVSTAALAEASVIAFHLHGKVLALVAAIYFFLIFALDRWLVSDPITGFVRPEGAIFTPIGWLGHLAVEVLKISARIGIAVLSSWLFASFLLLAVFNHEIQDQLKGIETQNNAKYNVQVQAVIDQLSAAAKTTVIEAEGKVQGLRDTYKAQQDAVIAAQKAEQVGLAAAHAKGVYCEQVPAYTWYTNRATGKAFRVQTGSTTECPQEIQDAESSYQTAVSRSQTPDQLQASISTIMNDPNVVNAQKTITDAASVAAQELSPEKPAYTDGLAARMRALGLIVHKPAGTCPLHPAAQDLATNNACIANYSPDVASMQENLRLWLFSIEIAPVVFKLLHSLLPRRGYAWQMAAKDYEAELDAQKKMEADRISKKAYIAMVLRLERVSLELETTMEEQQLREAARASNALGLQQIRGRLAKAITQNIKHARKDAEALSPAVEVVWGPNIRGFESEPMLRIVDDEKHLHD
jgi:hypothetical protein